LKKVDLIFLYVKSIIAKTKKLHFSFLQRHILLFE
jgi:hypothetical protein